MAKVAFRGDCSGLMSPDEDDCSVDVEGDHGTVGGKFQRLSKHTHEQVAETNGLVVSHHQDEKPRDQSSDGQVEYSAEQQDTCHVLNKGKDAVFQGRTFLIGNLGVVVVVEMQDSENDDAKSQSDAAGQDEEFLVVNFHDLWLIGPSPIFWTGHSVCVS